MSLVGFTGAWWEVGVCAALALGVSAAAVLALRRAWVTKSETSGVRDPVRHGARRVDLFLRELRAAAERRDDGVALRGIVPGRLSLILRVDGQETPLPLQPMLECWEDDPGGIGILLQHLVEEIREDGLDATDDFDFAELATDILPQVRTLDWVREHSTAFGSARLVHRAIGSDLAVCYVIDDSWSMVFVCEEHLGRWGLSEADVYGLARRNLAGRTDHDIAARLSDGRPLLLRSGDGYAAARLLLLETPLTSSSASDAEDLLIALPDRDTLWVGDAADYPDLGDLMERNEVECTHAPHPVSPSLYRMGKCGLGPA